LIKLIKLKDWIFVLQQAQKTMRRQWSYLNNLTFHSNNMAKVSMIEREKKREKLNKKYLAKINMIKEKLRDKNVTEEESIILRNKLQKIPLNALSVRKRNRCALTGRPRGVYRKFTLGRTKLREMAMQGLIPGLTKASW